jgi:YVTN family beta-propeller protein
MKHLNSHNEGSKSFFLRAFRAVLRPVLTVLLAVMFTTTMAQAAPFVYFPSRGGNLFAIDTATNTVVTTVPVGAVSVGAFGVAVTPDGAAAYVPNRGGVSVIDTATNTVVATVPTELASYDVAVTPDGAAVYVTVPGYSAVLVIDTASNTVTNTLWMGEPYCIAMMPDGTAVVTDPDDNMVEIMGKAIVPAGAEPFDVAVAPSGATIYVTNQYLYGAVSVIDTATYKVVATVQVGDGYNVAVAADGTAVYVSDGSDIAVIDTATNAVVAKVPVP